MSKLSKLDKNFEKLKGQYMQEAENTDFSDGANYVIYILTRPL